jgi:hypothetical protein
MARRKDPFGKSYEVFDTLVNNMYNKVDANQVAWRIDSTSVLAIFPLLNEWNDKWKISKHKATSTAVDRKATLSARKVLTKYLRPFVQKWIHYNRAMSEANIVACGFEPHIKTKHRIGKPDTEPDMQYKSKGTHMIEAYFRQQPGADGVSRRAKPDDVDSLLIAYIIDGGREADPEEFTKRITGRRSPLKIYFNPADAGKKVTFAACWLTKTLLQGNWCKLHTMIIP